LPVSRVRQSGLVQVQPHNLEKVAVVVPGRLKLLAVREGQFVRKGAVIAEFESQQLDDQELKFRTALEHNTGRSRNFEALLASAKEKQEREQLQTKKREADIQARTAQAALRVVEQSRRLLLLKAPRDGYVMGLPKIDEINKTWDQKDMEKEFCSI